MSWELLRSVFCEMLSRRVCPERFYVRCLYLEKYFRCLPPCPSTYNIHKASMLLSAIAKEESMGLSLRLRGGGAPDSKGKGA